MAADGISLDKAVDEFVVALREYAGNWEERLHAASNHRASWVLVFRKVEGWEEIRSATETAVFHHATFEIRIFFGTLSLVGAGELSDMHGFVGAGVCGDDAVKGGNVPRADGVQGRFELGAMAGIQV